MIALGKRVFRGVAGDAGKSGRLEKFLPENKSFVRTIPGGVNEVGQAGILELEF